MAEIESAGLYINNLGLNFGLWKLCSIYYLIGPFNSPPPLLPLPSSFFLLPLLFLLLFCFSDTGSLYIDLAVLELTM